MADLETPATEAREKGWTAESGDVESVRKQAALLGWVEVAPRRGEPTVSVVRPASASNANPNSLSAVYGLGQQPLRTEIVQIAAVAAGLAALFAAAPAAFTVLRLCGAAYLLYLGVQALRHARRGSPLDAARTAAHVTGRYAYLRGAATNLVNPTSVTFVVALLPQFVDRGLGHVPLQFAVLGAIFIAFEMLIDGTVGLTAGRLGSWLSRRQRARQALDTGSGTILVALAGRLAFER